MGSSGLLQELQHIQRMLAGKAGGAATEEPHPAGSLLHPALVPNGLTYHDEEEQQADSALQEARKFSKEKQRRLQGELVGLKQQLRHKQEECERLQSAAARDREDSTLIIERLQAQLLQQKGEVHQLSDLVLSLRGENDTLQQHLQQAAAQAHKNEKDTTQSVQQLSAAARQWRQQHEEVMRQLVQEQEMQAGMLGELRLLREQLQCAEERLESERREHQRVAARCAGLEAAFGAHGKHQAASNDLVAELKNRLKTERTWRKATQAWLKAELHTKDELERLLVNVGTSVRLGTQLQPRQHAAPATPQHQMNAAAASQQQPCVPAAAIPDARCSPVTAASPPRERPSSQPLPTAPSVPPVQTAEQRQPEQVPSPQQQPEQQPSPGAAAPGDWRSMFDTTLQSFEARYNKLQEELAMVKKQGVAAQPVR